MSEEEKTKALVDATADLLRAGHPIYEPGEEVAEYVVPADQYVKALQCLADLLGDDEMRRPEQVLEVDHGCND